MGLALVLAGETAALCLDDGVSQEPCAPRIPEHVPAPAVGRNFGRWTSLGEISAGDVRRIADSKSLHQHVGGGGRIGFDDAAPGLLERAVRTRIAELTVAVAECTAARKHPETIANQRAAGLAAGIPPAQNLQRRLDSLKSI